MLGNCNWTGNLSICDHWLSIGGLCRCTLSLESIFNLQIRLASNRFTWIQHIAGQFRFDIQSNIALDRTILFADTWRRFNRKNDNSILLEGKNTFFRNPNWTSPPHILCSTENCINLLLQTTVEAMAISTNIDYILGHDIRIINRYDCGSRIRAHPVSAFHLLKTGIPILFLIVSSSRVHVSDICGPFRNHELMFHVLRGDILKLQENHFVWRLVMFLIRPASIGGFLLTLWWVGINQIADRDESKIIHFVASSFITCGPSRKHASQWSRCSKICCWLKPKISNIYWSG